MRIKVHDALAIAMGQVIPLKSERFVVKWAILDESAGAKRAVGMHDGRYA